MRPDPHMRAPAAAAPRADAASWQHDQATALPAVLAAWSALTEQKQPPPHLEDVYSSRVSRRRRPGSYSTVTRKLPGVALLPGCSGGRRFVDGSSLARRQRRWSRLARARPSSTTDQMQPFGGNYETKNRSGATERGDAFCSHVPFSWTAARLSMTTAPFLSQAKARLEPAEFFAEASWASWRST